MTESYSTVLRDLSLVWSLLHILILCSFLYQPRFSRKTSTLFTCLFLIPVGAVCIAILSALAFYPALKWMIVFISTAGLIFFACLAKYRGARLLFTFFMAETIALIIIILTAIVDVYLLDNTGIFRFVARLILFPLLEWFAFAHFHKMYSITQEIMNMGWWLFTLTAIVCHALLTILLISPQSFLMDPLHIPHILLVCILIPLVYYAILRGLLQQHRLYTISRQEAILRLEREHMEDLIRQNIMTEERIRIERHDLRHRLKSIQSMLERGGYEDALTYIRSSTATLDSTKVIRYCQNPIVDAVFSSFFSDAEANHIRIESSLAVPHDLPVDATEFSIVIANALENAIRACLVLPEPERIIRCKYVIGPRHMCQISNPTAQEVVFDENGRPYSHEPGHGIGTHSIVAFCEKYNADLNYKYEDGWFHIRIVL